MNTIRMACEAMATRFEFVLVGPDPIALRAAGDEALEEIHRLEAMLSLYRPTSEIAGLNREAARGFVRVSAEVYRLVQHACLLSRASQGAFDITVGPLMRVWGLMRRTGSIPSEGDLATARASVGWEGIEFDEASRAIRFDRPGMMLDLGAIGKGYALDRAAELIRGAGVEHALLHGGTSTAVAWGQPPETEANVGAWRVLIDPPELAGRTRLERGAEPLAVVELRDESLSVSAVWGKGFEADGRFYGHVIDPRRGEPVRGAWLAAMVLPSATESDALSTALLVRGGEMVRVLREGGAPTRCLVAEDGGNAGIAEGLQVTSYGIEADAVQRWAR